MWTNSLPLRKSVFYSPVCHTMLNPNVLESTDLGWNFCCFRLSHTGSSLFRYRRPNRSVPKIPTNLRAQTVVVNNSNSPQRKPMLQPLPPPKITKSALGHITDDSDSSDDDFNVQSTASNRKHNRYTHILRTHFAAISKKVFHTSTGVSYSTESKRTGKYWFWRIQRWVKL